MAATTATALPRPSLLDHEIKHGPSKTGVIAFLAAVAAGVIYIVFHVAHDLDAASVTSYAPYAMLALALLIALGFEFVNGFHDTANAVATVIYTHSLEPNIAVVWSGICNLAGVLLSSGTVAFAVITPSAGMSGATQIGAHGEFAPVRVSSQGLICGGSKVTAPAPR